MKRRRFAALLLSLALLLGMALPAQANSWGLKSGLVLSAVQKTNKYNEYTALAQAKTQNGDVAIMASRYHAVLLHAYQENGQIILNEYHTAVKQPDETGYKKVKLTAKASGFVMQYSDMTLEYGALLTSGGMTFMLENVKLGTLQMQAGGENSEITSYLTCTQNGETRKWRAYGGSTPRLAQVNLKLFPRNLSELGAMQEMQTILWTQSECYDMPDGDDYGGAASGKTVAVYSAPSENAVRFAKGKASVSLRDTLRIYGSTQDNAWVLICYQVSDRTSRFGYIRRSDLPDNVQVYPIGGWADVAATTRQETYLTDDPEVSQYEQFTLAAGQSVRVLALYDMWYAYVETQQNGQTVRGFVPRAHLACALPEEQAANIEAQLIGSWESEGGGELMSPYLTFLPDNQLVQTEVPYDRQDELSEDELAEYGQARQNTYRVYRATARDKTWIWSGAEYLLLIYDAQGYVEDYWALDVTADAQGDAQGFSLTYWEGGEGFVRYPAETDEKING